MTTSEARSGHYVTQPTGYRAFIPAHLPPNPAILIDADLALLLSRADQAVGRLDGIAETVPNPDLFVAMYIRREAVLSSQIEGTQSSLDDVLTFELDPQAQGLPYDVVEVANYARAMTYGLERLATLPLSLRLIREIHAELLRDVRGADRRPGEFRTSQNWIGSAGASLAQAAFAPPPASAMHDALDNLERFLHQDRYLPALLHCGVAHAQFETIHPFLDGNGRVGRLLITFMLVHSGVLHRPLLSLSYYLKRHRAEYYDRLTAVHDKGDWERWLRFFVQGIAETAEEAIVTARAINALREEHRAVIQQSMGVNGLRLLDVLFAQPLTTVSVVAESLGITFNTAKRLLGQLEALSLLDETTGGQRNRRYRYTPYLSLFNM